MATKATMTRQYKWPPNNLYVYPTVKLKYRLEDSLWNGESIGVDLDV